MRKTAAILVCFLLVSVMLATSAVVFAGKPPKPPKRPAQPGTEYWIAGGVQPRIYQNTLFWHVASAQEIWMWDLGVDGIPETSDDGVKQLVASGLPSNLGFYRVWANRLVFDAWSGEEISQIYMIDLPDGAPYTVTEGDYLKRNPEIYGDVLVYESYPEGQTIPEGILNFHNPGSDGIFGNEDDAVYEKLGGGVFPRIWGNRVVSRTAADLIVYELEGGAPDGGTSLGKQYAWWPAIYENTIAWEDKRSGNMDIYMQVGMGEETPIATGGKSDYQPEIYDNLIVWYEYEYKTHGKGGHITDVYVHDLSTSDSYQLTNSGNGYDPDVFGNHIVYHNITKKEAGVFLFIFDSGGDGGQSAGVHPGTDGFMLFQNSPNPVRGRTAIRFTLAESAPVTLTVHDVAGRNVATVADREFTAGSHTVEWNPDVPSGTYFCRIQAGEFTATKRMTVIR